MKSNLLKTTLIAVAMVATTLTSVVPAHALTQNYAKTRLGGADRYATAVEISKEFVSDGKYCDTVILGRGDDFADSMSAGPLAVYYNAPILLTWTETLHPTTEKRMVEMNIKNVVIVGGTGVVSTNVENQLKAKGYHVVRLGGADRYETNALINAQIPKERWGWAPVISNGEDVYENLTAAVDMTSFTQNNADTTVYINPIFLARPETDNVTQLESIAKQLDSVKAKWDTYWNSVGITGMYAPKIDSQILQNETNRTGTPTKSAIYDRFGRNAITGLATTFAKNGLPRKYYSNIIDIGRSFNANVVNMTNKRHGVILATGSDFVDALASTPLAGKFSMPIVFADKDINDILNQLSLKDDMNFWNKNFVQPYAQVDHVYYAGGTAVVKDGAESYLNGGH